MCCLSIRIKSGSDDLSTERNNMEADKRSPATTFGSAESGTSGVPPGQRGCAGRIPRLGFDVA